MSQHVIEMPDLGMGTFRLEGNTAYDMVTTALDVGFRHIDTAQMYGNEAQVGQAIKDSPIPRDEIFVTTKVWHDKLSKNDFLASVKESLSKLKLDHVDLLLIHWPSPNDKVPMKEYLSELKKVKEQGLAKHIGVSNFTISNLKEAMQIIDAREIFTNQIEVHPYLTNTKLRAFCDKNDIHVTAYMPFVVGKVLKDEVIVDIANKYKASPAQVVLAWVNANGMTTIPSSTKRKNLEDNFDDSLKLDADDIARIDALDCNDRQANPDFSPQWDE